MFPQSVIHRDGRPPPLRGTQTVAPGRAWPGRLRRDGVLQTKGPLVRGGRPGDDSLLAQLPHHVLQTVAVSLVTLLLLSLMMSGRCRGMLRGIASPAILCHKEPAPASKAPYQGPLIFMS